MNIELGSKEMHILKIKGVLTCWIKIRSVA